VTNARNKSSTSGASFIARLTADEAPARRIANFLAESLDPAEVVCAAFVRPDKSWQVNIHFRKQPVQAELRQMIALARDEKSASTVVVERVAPYDWVKESLAGLQPVTAGRFIVHGAHDRARVPAIASASRSRRRPRSAPATTAPPAAACWRWIGWRAAAGGRVTFSISAPVQACWRSPQRSCSACRCWRPTSIRARW